MKEQQMDKQAERMLLVVAISVVLIFGLAAWDWICQRQADKPEYRQEAAVWVSAPMLSDWGRETGKSGKGTRAAIDDLPHSDFSGPDPLCEDTYLREDIPLSYDLQADLYGSCLEFGVDYDLALAVIAEETRFQNLVGDGGDSIGYMQIQPKWHKMRMERLGVTDLADPKSNFRVGCSLLADLLEGNTMEDALSLYNTGHDGSTDYSRSVMGKLQ